MVYSTCSIFRKENRDIIFKFLKENPDFEIEEISDVLKNKAKFFLNYLVDNKFLEVYQNEDTDGFFICKLSKK